ncbi:hypothetical protein [Hydrocoleum sp. CS-953]|uniref:hypothetical protein n=1 Tax=Hydrocoleum sp. CS-953 TaxID=1671698 RepID=UPI000B9AF696|nr:hypothetical protein [Hydrocoleum sp. CS-953]
MSASNEWEEWHLTPDGWIEGTLKTDFSRKEVEIPTNRVATYRYQEYLASTFSKMDRDWLKTSGDDEETITSLIELHGKYPTKFIEDQMR